MADDSTDERDWAVRAAVFGHIVAHGRPPDVAETAAAMGLPDAEVAAAYDRLHGRHALFLEPGTHTVRIANPFSGVPTPYRVQVGARAYWANCAWDALGIPAALGADAAIVAALPNGDGTAALAVVGEAVRGDGEVVHLPLPFRRWYDNLVET